MRYIKSFNESKDFLTHDEIVEEFKEILLPISDLGYDVGVEIVQAYSLRPRIYLRIVRHGDPTLVWNKEIEEEFNRLGEFSLENGFELSKVYYITEDSKRKVVSYDHFLEVVGEQIIVNLLFELEQITK